jgi:hypothetical protein
MPSMFSRDGAAKLDNALAKLAKNRDGMTKIEIIANRWRSLTIFQGMDTVPTTLAQNEILDLLDYIAELEAKIAEQANNIAELETNLAKWRVIVAEVTIDRS